MNSMSSGMIWKFIAVNLVSLVALAGTSLLYIDSVANNRAEIVAEAAVVKKIESESRNIERAFNTAFQSVSDLAGKSVGSINDSFAEANQKLGQLNQKLKQVDQLSDSIIKLKGNTEFQVGLAKLEAALAGAGDDETNLIDSYSVLQVGMKQIEQDLLSIQTSIGAVREPIIVFERFSAIPTGRNPIKLKAPDGYFFISSGWWVEPVNGSEGVLVSENRSMDDFLSWEFTIHHTKYLDNAIAVEVYAVAIPMFTPSTD